MWNSPPSRTPAASPHRRKEGDHADGAAEARGADRVVQCRIAPRAFNGHVDPKLTRL